MSELENKPENADASSLAGSTQAPSPEGHVLPTGFEAASMADSPKDAAPGTPGRVVPLRYPFTAGDKTLTSIVFSRRPKAKDLIQTHGATTLAEQELYSIAALAGINADDLMEMDGQDYLAVQKEWASFLGA